MQDEGMGSTTNNTKITSILQKIDYLHESAQKNSKLSYEIKDKLLGQEPKKDAEVSEKQPPEQGQLNQIIDALQTIVNTINRSNHRLVSVNKEL